MLNIQNLTYHRQTKPLFTNISFNLNEGKIAHIQGPNGIGKTTLLKLIAGLLQPEQGQVNWQEKNIKDITQNYAYARFYLGHELALKEHFTLLENLQLNFFVSKTYLRHCEGALMQIGLTPHLHQKVAEFSAGMKKKLSLLRLAFSEAKLWLLDEPFNHLDAQGQQWLTEIFEKFCAQGGIIIFTSHSECAVKVDQTIHLSEYAS